MLAFDMWETVVVIVNLFKLKGTNWFKKGNGDSCYETVIQSGIGVKVMCQSVLRHDSEPQVAPGVSRLPSARVRV